MMVEIETGLMGKSEMIGALYFAIPRVVAKSLDIVRQASKGFDGELKRTLDTTIARLYNDFINATSANDCESMFRINRRAEELWKEIEQIKGNG